MMNEEPVVSRALYEAIRMVLDDIQEVLHEAGCPQGASIKDWLQERLSWQGALREMLDDARSEMELVRIELGVPYEPHQTVFERTLEAVRAAGKVLGESNDCRTRLTG